MSALDRLDSPAGSAVMLGKRSAGFSLIELMVALVLGLVVALGVVTLFSATSKTNKVQDKMARLQENARYAMSRMAEDLRHANGLFCSNSGGALTNVDAIDNPGSMILGQDTLRTPKVYAKTMTMPDIPASSLTSFNGRPSPDSTALPSDFFSRGYECSSSSCTPTVPSGTNQIPAIGTGNGARAGGSDVLTVRYTATAGWDLSKTGSSLNCPSSALSSITIDSSYASDPSLTNFQSGDLLLLTDCNNGSLFAGSRSSLTFSPTASANFTPILCPTTFNAERRLFNFSRDFQSVTYYLKIVNDPVVTGRKISTLVRRVNGGGAAANAHIGGAEEEVAQGIERLDFRYGVEVQDGNTAYLTADQVQSRGGGSLTCPPSYGDVSGGTATGCLWRAVKSIEIHMLVNSIDDMALSADEMAYRYSQDSGYTAGDAPAAPPATLVSGLPSGKMLRREFTAVVLVPNFLP